MNRRFIKCLRIVAAVHVGVLVILLTTSGWSGFFHKNPEAVPFVEFVVEVPGPPPPDKKQPVVIDPEPESGKNKEPEKSDPDTLTLETKKKKVIEKSTQKVTRPAQKAYGGGATKTTLTREQIRKFLEMGAKPSDHTSIPASEEVRCFEVVRRTMYDAWNQPSAEDAANAVAEVVIEISRSGKIISRKMTKKSGNDLFDDSVMLAVNSVQYVEHLTPAFLDKFREISITFKLGQ